MSNELAEREVATGAESDRQGAHTPRRRPTGAEAAFNRVNRFFYSKHTGLLLILGMAILTLLGTLIEQAPPGLRDDPQAYAGWLQEVRPKYGGWTTPLDVLGMFHVFSSVWFIAISLLLALSIIACTVHRLPQLWQRATRPHTHVTRPFFEHAHLRSQATVPVPPEQAVTRVRDLLQARRYRVLADEKDGTVGLYADRNRFAPFGTVIAHAAFVIIIGGVLVSATTGFSESQFPVTVGSRVPVGHDTGLEVEAKSFSDTYQPDGRPKDYVSELVLYKDGQQVAEQKVRVNTPLRYDGVKFHQSYFGTSAIMTVTDSSGETVFNSGVPLQWTSDDDQESIGKFELPGELLVYVVTPASGQVVSPIPAGAMQIDVYRGEENETTASRMVAQGEPVQLGDYTYTFQRERQFTGLAVARDPGSVWVYLGSAMIMIGTCATMFFRHRRIWVRVDPTADGGSEVRAASSDRRDVGFESWFRRFSAEVSQMSAPADRNPAEKR